MYFCRLDVVVVVGRLVDGWARLKSRNESKGPVLGYFWIGHWPAEKVNLVRSMRNDILDIIPVRVSLKDIYYASLLHPRAL